LSSPPAPVELAIDIGLLLKHDRLVLLPVCCVSPAVVRRVRGFLQGTTACHSVAARGAAGHIVACYSGSRFAASSRLARGTC
jgi:hypothetical protein